MARSTAKLQKICVRLFADDIELIRDTFPGGYGLPTPNEVIRNVVHRWCNEVIRKSETKLDKPEIAEIEIKEL